MTETVPVVDDDATTRDVIVRYLEKDSREEEAAEVSAPVQPGRASFG